MSKQSAPTPYQSAHDRGVGVDPFQQQQQPQAAYQPEPQQQQQAPPGYQQPQYQQQQQQQVQYNAPPQKQPTYGAAGDGEPTMAAPLLSGGTQTGTPIYGDDCAPILKQKFVSQGYKDIWAGVLFLAQLVVMAVLAIMNAKNDKLHISFGSDAGSHQVHRLEEFVAYAFFMALGLCLVMMAVMRMHAKAYIWGANFLSIALWVGISLYMVSQGVGAASYIILIFALIHGVWLYFVRHRIPFAAVLLGHSVRTTQKNWGTYVVSFVNLGVLIVYLVGFLCMAIPVLNDLTNDTSSNSNNSSGDGSNDNGDGSSAKTYVIVCVFLLMWYWSIQVFTNVVHVTASGSVATWYFAGEHNMPPTPSAASCKRALTTSFGSICFGSLLVAILKLIHTILRSLARRGGCFACIAMCLVGLIERLMEYFNVYAFTHVAIYGMSYFEAGKATWEMIKSCGFAALFNDNLVYPVLNMTCLVDSIAIGAVLGIAANSFIIGLICFLVSYVVHCLILRVVYSGIVTIFVCVAECEDVLAMTNPPFHQEIQEAKAVMQQSAC